MHAPVTPTDNKTVSRAEDLVRVIEMQREIATANLGLEDLIRLVCRRTAELIPVEGAVVELVEGDEMVYRAVSGVGAWTVGLRLSINHSLSGLSVRLNEVLRCDDVELDPRVDQAAARRMGLRSMICVPLVHRGSPVGVLKVCSREVAAFTGYQTDLLRMMAGLLSAVISQAHETEAKQRARAALSENEIALRTLVDTAFEAIVISKGGLITQCNPRFLALFDVEPARAVGRPIEDFVAPFDRARVSHNMKINYAEFYEFTALRRNHETFPVEGRGITLEVGGERLRISTIRDVTERRCAEEAMRRSGAASVETARLQNEVLARASRHLRGHLTDVRDGLDRLAEAGLNPAAARIATEIRGAAERGLRFVEDINDGACLAAESDEGGGEGLDLAGLVREVINSFASAARAKGVRLDLEVDVGLPRLRGSPRRLRQTLNGLIEHALDVTPDGGVRTRVRLITRGPEGYRVRVDVTDAGPGLSESAVAHLLRDRAGRSGLGVARRLVESVGGHFGVAPAPGAGDCISFELTLAPCDQ